MMRHSDNDLELGPIVGGRGRLHMTADQRSTHLHVVGNTGSGKTKFIENLIRQDILANRTSGCGILVIDPHGSLFSNIMRWLARHGLDRPVTPINLGDEQTIIAYNLLRKRKTASASVVVDSMIDAMAHVWGAENTDQTPRFPRWAGNTFHALYEKGRTLPDAIHLLSNRADVREAMTGGLSDDVVRTDWDKVRTYKPREFDDEVSSTVNRLRRFVGNKHMRSVFGQTGASFDIGAALEEGHIVIVNLSQEGGTISEENARLYGTLLLNDLWTAAKERGKRDGVKPFYVYVDEFQQFLTPTIANNLDQSRGFGIHWTLSHQFPAQLRDDGENGKRVYNSVMENARSKVVFSLGTEDNLKPMAQWLFTGIMNTDEVKHSIYSTKVLEYREEYRRAFSRGATRSSGGTHHSSSSQGEGAGGSSGDDSRGDIESWNSYYASSEGSTDSWSESNTESTTDVPTLVPVMGKELSSVQFRSPEEQLFRAMAVLFDQEQRQCIVRLKGMKAPVSLFTPFIEQPNIRPERVEEYMQSTYGRLPFALDGPTARERVDAHSRDFAETIARESPSDSDTDEPITGKRRIR